MDNDAGNRPLDHYKARLGPMRNRWRNAMLPFIRWETPILAKLQERCRHPVLDIFFALTANLGTHTAYVVMLPGAFWYGHSHIGRSLVFCLAFGVYLTNVFKDLLCLPRPLSPPLHRLTMSGSAALEYGFPSTHTANSVSVSFIVATWFVESKDSFATTFGYYFALFAVGFYLASIVIGRVYCGMHGFLDVLGGFVIGVGLWWFYVVFGPWLESFIFSSSWHVILAVPIVLTLVRIHPEPADDCPCFDDGVAFLGVLAGCNVGEWHFVHTIFSNQPANVSSIPFDFSRTGITGSILRFVVGSILISIWRPVMKRFLYQILPPVFRLIERVGLSMPRRFFTPASQYSDIPSDSMPDAKIFETQNITKLFTKAGRARADSVGPQSAADVYEGIAYREYQAVRRRRNSAISDAGSEKGADNNETASDNEDAVTATEEELANEKVDMSSVVLPRVRYDVEVITKFIVYCGVGVLSVDIAGICFGLLHI